MGSMACAVLPITFLVLFFLALFLFTEKKKCEEKSIYNDERTGSQYALFVRADLEQGRTGQLRFYRLIRGVQGQGEGAPLIYQQRVVLPGVDHFQAPVRLQLREAVPQGQDGLHRVEEGIGVLRLFLRRGHERNETERCAA